jgi:NDP-sugar pyrophosphorylase family protein
MIKRMPPVLILCGGLGTRVKDMLQDVPKILAPIGDRCFLEYLMAYLQRQNIRNVYFALGVGAEKVRTFLDVYDAAELNIQLFQEVTPLGTLGAITYALNELSELPDDLLVINGDTFIDLNLASLCEGVNDEGRLLGAVAVWVEDVSRYGELVLSDAQGILAFREKSESESRPGWVNGGVYYFKQPILSKLKQHQGTSLERDYLQREIQSIPTWCLQHRGLFLDIGTPDSLAGARNNFTALKDIMFSA